MAGWGFGNSQIILTHSLGHSIGAVFDIPHSMCIGAMLWYMLMYNKVVESHRIADLARLVGFDGSSDEEITSQFISAVREFIIKLEMPLSIKDMGITRDQYEANLEQLVEYAENDSGTLSNPRPVDYEAFLKIFECVYEGKEISF